MIPQHDFRSPNPHVLRNAAAQRRVLRAQTGGPAGRADINTADATQKSKRQSQQRNQNSQDDDLNSKSIEQAAEDERG